MDINNYYYIWNDKWNNKLYDKLYDMDMYDMYDMY